MHAGARTHTHTHTSAPSPSDSFQSCEGRPGPGQRVSRRVYHVCVRVCVCVHIQVSYVDAILGTQVKVTTVDGPVELKIPAGTQPGTTLLMAKRGAPRLGNSTMRGDHSVGC